MTTRPRLARGAALALAVALMAAGPAVGGDGRAGRADNVAVAVNTKDGSSLFRTAFSIRRVMGDVVDESNAAVAFASCDECETIAIALQVVLVFSDPDVVTPTNLALAINQGCSSCETLASAYQWVLGTEGPVRFTADGNRRLAELRLALQRLRDSELDVFALQAELDELTAELWEVLSTELVPVAQPAAPAGDGATTTTPATSGAATSTTTTTGDVAPSTSTSAATTTTTAPPTTTTETSSTTTP